MSYITTKQMAEKLNINIRTAQRLLKNGKITNAKKVGNTWLIPDDFDVNNGSRYINYPYENLPYSYDEHIHDGYDSNVRLLADAQFDYFRGNHGDVKKNFKKVKDNDSTKLTFASLAAYSSISSGDYTSYNEIKTFLDSLKNITEHEKMIVEVIKGSWSLSIFSNKDIPEWLETNQMVCEGSLKVEYIYQELLYLRMRGYFYELLAACKSVYLLRYNTETFTVFDIYCLLMMAQSYYMIDKKEAALEPLERAIDLCIEYGFSTPLAEYISSLGGMTEKLLKVKNNDFLKKVLNQWKETEHNWINFHNYYVEDNISEILTLKEIQVAKLLAKDLTYMQICEKMGLSMGRVKNIINEIYNKLYVSSRKELKKFTITKGELDTFYMGHPKK